MVKVIKFILLILLVLISLEPEPSGSFVLSIKLESGFTCYNSFSEGKKQF